ncbi:DUF7342 family protein [Halobellus sp. EA9]|uniref:DUF7342 family protein n=1 Tax=Halobellus sp. EA9 TaxID=3421647 RepID=UPI003EBA78F1
MTSGDDHSDADRIALGLAPLQGERLYDLGDLRRVLDRLGHDTDDDIPTTFWDYVEWPCPMDDCDGGLRPVNTGVWGLPADPNDLDESVDCDDPEQYIRLSEAQKSTVPVVVCYDCGSVFKANFRRLRDSEEDAATSLSDTNERVASEWGTETTPFDRILTVVKGTYEAQPVDEIADRARTTPTMARNHLNRLADLGYVEAVTTEQTDTLYRCSSEAVAFHEACRISSETDSETLDKRIAELQEELQLYQERFGTESPEEAATMDADVNCEALREWRTTRRDLRVTQVALALGKAAEVVHPESDDFY